MTRFGDSGVDSYGVYRVSFRDRFEVQGIGVLESRASLLGDSRALGSRTLRWLWSLDLPQRTQTSGPHRHPKL